MLFDSMKLKSFYFPHSFTDHPEFVEQASKKDSLLDDRLKQVFVTSSDYVSSRQRLFSVFYQNFIFQLEQKRYIDPEKPLPLIRTTPAEYDLGYHETDVKRVPRGKCTLRQAIKFISEHQQKPDEVTAEMIANEFKLKQETVGDILEHFRMFAIHIPIVEGKTKKFLIDPFDSKSKNFEKVLAESRIGKTK